MERIKDNLITSSEKEHIFLFQEALMLYVDSSMISFVSLEDYRAILSEIFDLWFLRYNSGDLYRFAKTYKAEFDSVMSKTSNAKQLFEKLNIFNEPDGVGSLRFSEKELITISNFINDSSSFFSSLSDLVINLSDFIEKARISSDCDISFAAYYAPYFDRLLLNRLEQAADYLNQANDIMFVIWDDFERQNRRMTDSNVSDESIESRKAEIERKVREIGVTEEDSDIVVSNVITINFPADLFDMNYEIKPGYYSVPFGGDDYVLIAKSRVKPSRFGGDDFVIASKYDMIDKKVFMTFSGEKVSFDELRKVILDLMEKAGMY